MGTQKRHTESCGKLVKNPRAYILKYSKKILKDRKPVTTIQLFHIWI
jgi:hypothetical protein